MNTCKNCVYWKTDDDRLGKCRRYPPSVIAREGFANNEVWPETFKNDWCGEHKIIDRKGEQSLDTLIKVIKNQHL